MYLPPGAQAPSPEALRSFLEAARAVHPSLPPDDAFEIRWIGLDADTTRQIFELIRAGDKTGTFTLPWIVERTGQPVPAAGRCIVLIDMDGTPTLLVRLTRVRLLRFGEVTAADTAIDGSPVRDPSVWVPLHTQYWNALLEPFGLAVTPQMPFWTEEFELLHDAG